MNYNWWENQSQIWPPDLATSVRHRHFCAVALIVYLKLCYANPMLLVFILTWSVNCVMMMCFLFACMFCFLILYMSVCFCAFTFAFLSFNPKTRINSHLQMLTEMEFAQMHSSVCFCASVCKLLFYPYLDNMQTPQSNHRQPLM